MALTITNEDNMTLMARYPDKHFDLAIVDPEYGIGASSPTIKDLAVKQKNGTFLNVKPAAYKKKNWDSKPADASFFKELFRVSKNQIIWGENYFSLPVGGRIVWDKLNGESDQFGCEIAYCSLNKRTDIVYYLWAGFMQGVYCGKEVRKALVQQGNKKLNEKRMHPTQKPVLLNKYLLENYAKPADKILDTNFGYGGMGIACHDYGFDLTACELDKEYFDAAMNRITNHTNQAKMEF